MFWQGNRVEFVNVRKSAEGLRIGETRIGHTILTFVPSVGATLDIRVVMVDLGNLRMRIRGTITAVNHGFIDSAVSEHQVEVSDMWIDDVPAFVWIDRRKAASSGK